MKRYVPSNYDQVSCNLTSSLVSCFFPNPAQSNTIIMVVVPVTGSVSGIVPSPLKHCFDASDSIIVDGGGASFNINAGAQATMIAGRKISYLYGTSVSAGGYMHSLILQSKEIVTMHGSTCMESPVRLQGCSLKQRIQQ